MCLMLESYLVIRDAAIQILAQLNHLLPPQFAPLQNENNSCLAGLS